jgi:hypothetical protein
MIDDLRLKRVPRSSSTQWIRSTRARSSIVNQSTIVNRKSSIEERVADPQQNSEQTDPEKQTPHDELDFSRQKGFVRNSSQFLSNIRRRLRWRCFVPTRGHGVPLECASLLAPCAAEACCRGREMTNLQARD